MMKSFIVFLFSALCSQYSFSSLFAPDEKTSEKIQMVHEVCGITSFEEAIACSGIEDLDQISLGKEIEGDNSVVLCAAHYLSSQILQAMHLPEADDLWAVYGISKESNLDERVVIEEASKYGQIIKIRLEEKSKLSVLEDMEQKILDVINKITVSH